jgi:hypothetical protein
MLHPKTNRNDKTPVDKYAFPLISKRWESLIYHHWNKLVDELSNSLVALSEKAEATKLFPAYMYIHYLRTSVSNKLPLFRLDFFDANKWNGNTQCWVYWDTGVVTDLLFVCMPENVGEHLSSKSIKENAELEKKWLQTADILHGVMKKAIEALMQEAMDKASFEIGCDVYYGEYMATTKKIRI